MKFRILPMTPNLTILRNLVFPAVVLCTVLPTYAQSVDTLANREIARRQDDIILAEQLVAKGDKAVANGDFENAYLNYLDAVDKVPAGSASGKYRGQVMTKFSKAGISYAEYLIQRGHYSEAEQVAKTILLPDYNPTYKPAIQLLSNLEQPDYYNKTVTPQFADDKDLVIKWLSEADGYYQSGRFDLAIKRYEQVLNVDRYNIAARKGMEQVNLAKTQYYSSARNETRARMLWQVDEKWERPIRKFQDGRSTANTTQVRVGTGGTEAITAKLNRIIIPKLDLQDATVADAVELLKQRSRELDNTTTDPSAKRGVNIVLKLPPAGAAPEPAAAPAAAGGAAAEPPAAVESGTSDTLVSLSLTNVPLIEALRYLTELSKLKYKVEPYAVSIVPLSENNVDLVQKEYRVPPSFIPPASADAAAGADAAPAQAGGGINGIDPSSSRLAKRMPAQEFLASQGIPFPAGASAQYITTGSKLIVRNTPDALDLVDLLVDAVANVQPTQVEIESKFLEVSQDNLKELGFNWLLGPVAIGGGVYGAGGTEGYGNNTNPTSPNPNNYPVSSSGTPIGTNPVTAGLRSGVGNNVSSAVSANSIDALLGGVATGAAPGIFGLSGIFSNPQFQVVIRALDQKKGVDLLSAPKVTTKSGQKAIFRSVREFPYPSEFNPPEPPPPNTNDGVISVGFGDITTQGIVTPSTPTAFEKRNLGVTLEVEPIVGPDGYTIDLSLSPEVVDFDGFINYGSPILGAQGVFIGGIPVAIQNTVITPNVVNQPIFSTRKVTTSVSIWDGQTVALGGLIREDVQKVQDKVPLLGDIPLAGRLFRSNVDQKIKRNLIIFVTARLLDAEGRPVRQEEDQEEVIEPLGLPQELPPPTFQEKGWGK
jgi:general secretion pathway protein D